MAPSTPIVVAYASAGSGHRIAAEAVARELRTKGGERVSVELIDALAMGSNTPSGDDLTSTFTGPTASLYDAIWSSSKAGRIARRLGTPVLAWAFRRFTAHLRETRPAAVVCTHALPALLAAWEVRRGRLDTKVLCVATDFGVHGLWPREDVTLFCAADSHSAEELERRGHELSAIAVTGIPVRPQFTAEYDVAAAREHFGLPAEKRVILAVAGSTQPGPYARFKEALAVSLPALASLPGVNLAVVTGQDDSFADEMKSRSAGFGTTNVHILGYVEHMAPLMAASDLALAKPGGLVCAECIAMGLPLVLVGPAVGQERANADALSRAGAALFAEDPRMLAEYVRKAASKPARLAKMRTAATELSRPFAAADVAERVLGLIGLKRTDQPE
jgi:processive 1,2-diacylglycerol beta-glucosyltransferase